MAFPEYPFKSHLPSFITHRDVRMYLVDFSHDNGINDYIRFHTRVEKISPISNGTDCFPTWSVTSCNLLTKLEVTELFDAVMVCNGHYAVPHLPAISNMGKFKGEIVHSHSYRTPQPYANKTIVVLGAGPSATDISIDLTSCAKHVIMSHRAKIKDNMPKIVEQRPAVVGFTRNGVVLSDSSECDCDAVIFCTGYEYSFPFIKEKNVVEIKEGRVTPLYKHLISINFPNLSFIGLCQKVCPFPQFDCQVAFAYAVLKGSAVLPSYKEMLLSEDDDYQDHKSKGLPDKNSHLLGAAQWEYNDALAEACNEPTISPIVEKLYKDAHIRRYANIADYRKVNYIINQNGNSFDVEERLDN